MEKNIWDTEIDITFDGSAAAKAKSRAQINAKSYISKVAKIKAKRKANYELKKEQNVTLREKIKELLESIPATSLMTASDFFYLHNNAFKVTYIIQKTT